jgi:hypothetical protein
MAVRQTSIDCYNQIKANGLLSKRRFEAYEALIKVSPCTATELQNSMDYNNGGRDCMKRISELRDLGVIYEKSIRRCKVTGKNVIEWDLTDKLPIKKENKPIVTKKQKIQEILDEISDFGKTLSNEEDKIALRSIYLKIKSLG